MKTRILALAALLIGATTATASRADELVSALEKVSKDQIAAFNKEDAAATMSFAYSKSPNYDTSKVELATLFADTDAKAEQVGFAFVGHDDEFAVARVKVKVTAADPGFQNNIVDALMIFHSEGGAWKVWDTYVLGSRAREVVAARRCGGEAAGRHFSSWRSRLRGAAEEQPLVCFGNEPSWSVDLTQRGVARFSMPDQGSAEFWGSAARIEHLGEAVWRGAPSGGPGAGGELVVLLRDGACSDTMSDTVHPVNARVSLPGGRFLAGCCRAVVAGQLRSEPRGSPVAGRRISPDRTPARSPPRGPPSAFASQRGASRASRAATASPAATRSPAIASSSVRWPGP